MKCDQSKWITHESFTHKPLLFCRSGVSLAIKDNNGSFISTLRMALFEVLYVHLAQFSNDFQHNTLLTITWGSYWNWPAACVHNCLSALTQRTTHIQLVSSYLQRVSCWKPGFLWKSEPLISQRGTLLSLRPLWIMLFIIRWPMIWYKSCPGQNYY